MAKVEAKIVVRVDGKKVHRSVTQADVTGSESGQRAMTAVQHELNDAVSKARKAIKL